MNARLTAVVSLFAVLGATVLACAGTNGDRFVPASGGTSSVGKWVTTSDGRVKIPLAAGLSWETRASPDSLLKAGAPEGPTFVVVAVIDGAPTPIARATCAETHKARILLAATQKGIMMTTPEITSEQRKGEPMPRLHYAVPLEASGDAPPASTLSSWGYLVDANRCIGIGVTTIVRAQRGTTDKPDPEDMQRLEHVFELAIDGAELIPR